MSVSQSRSRRVGASWKEAADVMHDMMFRKYYHVGVNSKSEKDSIHLFRKMTFIYENLPAFMKANIGSKNGMNVEYFIWGKDEANNKIKKGNQNELTVVAPTDSAYEGLMLHKWVCDEAGKIPNLGQMWSFPVTIQKQRKTYEVYIFLSFPIFQPIPFRLW